jgi:hypothetical protein
MSNTKQGISSKNSKRRIYISNEEAKTMVKKAKKKGRKA